MSSKTHLNLKNGGSAATVAWKIMLVDDDRHNHRMIRLFLKNFTFENKPLQFISAYSGAEAKILLRQHPDTALMFLDMVMEEVDAGLQVADFVRKIMGNKLTRIVVLTGQPNHAVEEVVIKDYDINDYKLKVDFTRQKLTTTVLASLRAYRDLMAMAHHSKELAELSASLAARSTQLEYLNKQLETEIEQRKRVEQSRSTGLAPVKANTGKGTILVVDDHPVSLQALNLILVRNGYQVRGAVNGEMALESAASDPPDLILLDIMLPDTDGFAVCRKLKATPQTADIPVIFVSALGAVEDKVQAFAAGGVDYVTKPVQVEEVLVRVSTHLVLRTMQKQLEEKNLRLEQEITERQKAETEVVEQRNLLRAVIDTVPDYIFVKDTASRFMINNKAHLAVLGAHSQEEVVGKTDSDLFSPQLAQSYRADEQAVIESGQSLLNREESYSAHNSDEIRWVSTTKVPLRNSSGDIVGLVGRSRDITEQKQAEEELRRYEFIVNTSKELMTLIDRDHNYAAASSAFCQAHNKSRAKIVGQHVSSVWGRQTYIDRLQDYLNTSFEGVDVQYEYWFEFGMLGSRYIDATYCPYYDSQGVVTHLVVVSRDITDYKNAEAALKRANTQKEQLLAALPSILIGINGENTITHWNAHAEALFDIDRAEAVGLCLKTCGIQWDWSRITSALTDCRHKGHPLDLHDVRYIRADGKEGFLKFTITPFADSGSLLLVGQDNTERKVLEGKLAQAQKLEAVGQLAAGIAHEINTPTQYIADNVGFVQASLDKLQTVLNQYRHLLEAGKSGTLSPDLIAAVEDTVRQVRLDYLLNELPLAVEEAMEGIARVTEIVTAMKVFSHPGVETKMAVDINQAIKSTIAVARNAWKYVATIKTDFDPDLPPVLCYPGELNQVILNIFVNAIQAIAETVEDKAEGKGTITVVTRQDGEWVEICISDTGPGIPEAIKPRIFDPFFTTKEVGQGTGQGLAISHAVIVERHGGALNVESQLGQGAAFVIRLPLEAGHDDGAAADDQEDTEMGNESKTDEPKNSTG